MTFTIAGIIAALGVLFGLNFFGLFLAAYFFDRSARHILWYLASSIAFITSGIAFALASSTPNKFTYLTLDDLTVGLGFVLLGLGMARAFELPLNKRLFVAVGLFGLLLVPLVTPRGEIDTLRLIFVSLWHIFFPLVIGGLLLSEAKSSNHARFLGVLLIIAAMSIFIRPALSLVIQADTSLPLAAQVEVYGAIAGVAFIVPMLGISAVLFFQVMSNLVTRYRNASITDILTGIPNRRGFLEAARNLGDQPAALLMIDVDRFKQINDTYGHQKGDEVLVAVARIIDRMAPDPHLSGRLGGEEFAILLSYSEMPTAEAVAQSLRTAIAIEMHGFVAEGHVVTVSVGAAELGDGGIERAMINADHALYDAKNGGRNQVVVANGNHRKMPSRMRDYRIAS